MKDRYRTQQGFLTWSRIPMIFTKQQAQKFIIQKFKHYGGLKYYIAQQKHAQSDDFSQDQNRHIHAYVLVTNRPSIDLKTGLDCFRVHPNACFGDFRRHISYLRVPTNHKSQQDLDHYPVTNMDQAQLATCGLTAQKRMRWHQKRMCQDTNYLRYCRDNQLITYSQFPQIKKGYDQVQAMLRPKYQYKNCAGVWLMGQAGIGKTGTVCQLLKQQGLDFAIVGCKNGQWMDGYSGQLGLVLDDLTPFHPRYANVLRDAGQGHFGTSFNIKGSQVYKGCRIVIVTSQYTPQQIWPTDYKTVQAVTRRFPLIDASTFGWQARILDSIQQQLTRPLLKLDLPLPRGLITLL